MFVGFHKQRFNVKGQANRVYNILSLPLLQLNTRFVEVKRAMNATQQLSVRQRQGKLLSALRAGATAGTGGDSRGSIDAATTVAVYSLPSTTAWSHAGLYMGEAGVQLSGQRLLVQAGAYVSGFTAVRLDGEQLPVSSDAVVLMDGSSIWRPTSSVVKIRTPEVQFELRNSDHFINLHSAQLVEQAVAQLDHIDGLLGQTADQDWKTHSRSKAFVQHLEQDFMLPQGTDELWSTAFEHNRYIEKVNTS